MHRNTLFSFDILSERPRQTAREIEIPLIDTDSDNSNNAAILQKQCQQLKDKAMCKSSVRLSNFQKFCISLERLLPVINPDEAALLGWNMLNILMVLYNFIEIPIILFVANRVSKDKEESNVLELMNVISIGVFFADLLLVRTRIAYFDNEILVKRYEQTLRHYLKVQIYMDVIPILVLIIYFFVGVKELIYLKMLFYLKLYSLLKINHQVENKIMFTPYFSALYKFLRMVSFIYFVTSLIACIYFAIDYHYYLEKGFYFTKGFLWLTGSATTDYINLIEHFEWPVWYDYALYWAVQTSSGVGYGNMTPRNPPEVLLCNLVMLTTIVLFVIFAGTVISIINQLQESNLRKQVKLSELNNFKTVNEVSKQSREKIEFYIQSLIKSNEDENEKYLLEILSENLQTDFKLAYKRQIFDNLQILKMLTQDDNSQWRPFARDLVSVLNYRYSSTGDYIVTSNTTSSFILGFLVRGKVTAFNPITDYEKDFREWEYFGQREFFFGGKAFNQIICRTFTKYYYFQRQTFFKMMKQYPQIHQKCCELIDDVRFHRKETEIFEVRCENCDQFHLLERCPINSLWKDRLPKLSKYHNALSDQPHQRTPKQRSRQIPYKLRGNFIHPSFNLDTPYKTTLYFPYDNL